MVSSSICLPLRLTPPFLTARYTCSVHETYNNLVLTKAPPLRTHLARHKINNRTHISGSYPCQQTGHYFVIIIPIMSLPSRNWFHTPHTSFPQTLSPPNAPNPELGNEIINLYKSIRSISRVLFLRRILSWVWHCEKVQLPKESDNPTLQNVSPGKS